MDAQDAPQLKLTFKKIAEGEPLHLLQKLVENRYLIDLKTCLSIPEMYNVYLKSTKVTSVISGISNRNLCSNLSNK